MPTHAALQITAKVDLPIATMQLVRFDFRGPAAGVIHSNHGVWLEHRLSPRAANARACLTSSWSPHRYEPLGDACLVPPGESLHAKSDGDIAQRALLCHLHLDAMTRWLGTTPRWSPKPTATILNLKGDKTAALLMAIGHKLQTPNFAGCSDLEWLATQLAVAVFRHDTTLSARTPAGKMAPWRLRLIDARVRDMTPAPTLEELAALCDLSVRQLARSFTATRQQSLGNYIAQCRMEHARRLLATNRCLKSVAAELGFASQSSFSYAFRTATGETPKSYRIRVHSQSEPQSDGRPPTD